LGPKREASSVLSWPAEFGLKPPLKCWSTKGGGASLPRFAARGAEKEWLVYDPAMWMLRAWERRVEARGRVRRMWRPEGYERKRRVWRW